MAENNYITKEEADAAKKMPLGVNPRVAFPNAANANYFTEEVRREISERYGEKKLYEGGLSVRATLDPKMQGWARKALVDGLVRYDQAHGWRGPVTKVDLTGRDWGMAAAEVGRSATWRPGGSPWCWATAAAACRSACSPSARRPAQVGKDRETGVIPPDGMRWAGRRQAVTKVARSSPATWSMSRRWEGAAASSACARSPRSPAPSWPWTPIPAASTPWSAASRTTRSAILWMCRVIGGRLALAAVVVCAAVLVGTHTRTALLGVIIALVLASASLFLGRARVRHTSVSTLLVGLFAGTVFAEPIIAWAARGQSAQDAAQLTGRTKVWSALLQTNRPTLNEIFGNGLSNKSFNGLAIDSNWVASYQDLGWVGIVIQVLFLLTLLVMAATHVRGARRAVALFLTVYCIVASFTETGTGDASTYLLDLAVAGALLVPEPSRRLRGGGPR